MARCRCFAYLCYCASWHGGSAAAAAAWLCRSVTRRCCVAPHGSSLLRSVASLLHGSSRWRCCPAARCWIALRRGSVARCCAAPSHLLLSVAASHLRGSSVLFCVPVLLRLMAWLLCGGRCCVALPLCDPPLLCGASPWVRVALSCRCRGLLPHSAALLRRWCCAVAALWLWLATARCCIAAASVLHGSSR